MTRYDVKVSLTNGYVLHVEEEGESENEVKNEFIGESGTYNKDGVSFFKEHVISVEVSEIEK
ncbi:hypothetical protein [Natribacillus halophilus]|uniref:Uncharacterized protein n=1 Tax=Natribacillus halophilus TaxID=549003 RepID=A0A1G8RKE9_9BACI|nr:hypothetical protein [Natribacillus halophilus]SDJ16985.1 hypothetical protein SAMN04488123_11834 [Natribacillus halophilus]